MFRDPRLARMATFLGSIGIEMRGGTVTVATLFPGSLVSHGSLIVDVGALHYCRATVPLIQLSSVTLK
jgi:hypothetical protein